MKGSSDEKLIFGLLSRDREIIKELYARMRAPASKLISQLGGQRSDVEDILQEAIIGLYVNLKKNQYQQHNHVKLSSYVLQIVKYQWLNKHRKAYQKREQPIENNYDYYADIDIHKDLENLERNQQILKIIRQLPQRCQKILEMFYWQKQNILQISQYLNITPESAKNAKYRCMQKVKSLYKHAIN